MYNHDWDEYWRIQVKRRQQKPPTRKEMWLAAVMYALLVITVTFLVTLAVSCFYSPGSP